MTHPFVGLVYFGIDYIKGAHGLNISSSIGLGIDLGSYLK